VSRSQDRDRSASPPNDPLLRASRAVSTPALWAARPTTPLGAEASQNEVMTASQSIAPRNNPTRWRPRFCSIREATYALRVVYEQTLLRVEALLSGKTPAALPPAQPSAREESASQRCRPPMELHPGFRIGGMEYWTVPASVDTAETPDGRAARPRRRDRKRTLMGRWPFTSGPPHRPARSRTWCPRAPTEGSRFPLPLLLPRETAVREDVAVAEH
jgi:hypothetical protein